MAWYSYSLPIDHLHRQLRLQSRQRRDEEVCPALGDNELLHRKRYVLVLVGWLDSRHHAWLAVRLTN